MTNVARTLNQFFSSFGIPAYEEHTIPDDAVRPYITYTPVDGDWHDPASISATVWYSGTTFTELFEKVDEIKKTVGEGLSLHVPEGGAVYIYRDTPFSQTQETGDDNVKAAYLLFEVQAICN